MTEMLYTMSIALPITLSCLGTSIGQGFIGKKTLKAVDLQPQASPEINKISLVGMTLTETSAILGFVISILLFLDTTVPVNVYYATMGRIGIGIAVGLSGFIAGVSSSLPAQAACISVARQPFFSNKILQLMLLTQTVIMTSNIFGFLIALLINTKVSTAADLNSGLQLLAAGISIGFGSIGPCIGLSLFTYSACIAIGVNRKSYGKILPFTFIGEAIIETPALFSLIISLLILNMTMTSPDGSVLKGIACLASAICIGLSSIGTGIGTGRTGSAACLEIGRDPENYSMISKVGLIALAMIDTCAIYGFIISMMLIFTI